MRNAILVKDKNGFNIMFATLEEIKVLVTKKLKKGEKVTLYEYKEYSDTSKFLSHDRYKHPMNGVLSSWEEGSVDLPDTITLSSVMEETDFDHPDTLQKLMVKRFYLDLNIEGLEVKKWASVNVSPIVLLKWYLQNKRTVESYCFIGSELNWIR